MESKYPDRWRGIKRLVGNRAQIFLENAVIMYYMSSFYLEYTTYVLHEVKEGNALHRRLDEKLRSAEVIASTYNNKWVHRRHQVSVYITRVTPLYVGLRARAIAFIHLQQPLRVATKSNKYGGGKAPKQSHMLSIWQRLMQVSQDMARDPEFLFDSDYFVFDGVSTIISDSCKHYRESKVCITLE